MTIEGIGGMDGVLSEVVGDAGALEALLGVGVELWRFKESDEEEVLEDVVVSEEDPLWAGKADWRSVRSLSLNS